MALIKRLSRDDKQEIMQIIKIAANSRRAKQAEAILLASNNYNIVQISENIRVLDITVEFWIDEYKRNGITSI